jgi:outer membrane protein OmpA-like peptidoglycan-associated protein
MRQGCLQDRWVDWSPNKGKRQGAFSTRVPKDTHPFIMMSYTDSVGSEDYNQGLSRRRAESVQSYLVRQGVDPARLTASGLGEGSPVADNESAAGRQQNRRVEVIISNPALAAL